MQCGLQQLEVVDRRLFGEFDHHLARRDAEILQQLQGTTRLVGGFEQGFRRNVEEQLAGQLLFVETPASALPTGDLQLAQTTGLAGDCEQCDGRVQRAVGGAAAEGFVAENSSLREADDRLEQTVQTALSQNRAQRTQLFGCGHGILWR
ncbi:hypothetical protein D3C73_799380 [compost metagenome]